MNGRLLESTSFTKCHHMNIWNNPGKPVTGKQDIARTILGLMLMAAGTSHLTVAREEFQAQVPDWVPLDKDDTVLLSGVAEILLGASLTFWEKKRVFWGWESALFFTLIFPGNISQLASHRDAFGLNSDASRSARLLLQPALIAWALWSTGAVRAVKKTVAEK